MVVKFYLLLLMLLFAVAGLCLESKLITPAELRTRVPMTMISEFSKFPIRVQTQDFVLASNETPPLFTLTGRDRRGKPWLVILRDAVHHAWATRGRGGRTYYFDGYTGAAGMGPFMWILAISFDTDGMPVPFFVVTHGTSSTNGIDDVLDLDGTGAELLEQDYWGSRMEDPGHFVTTLYQRRGAYWYRSDGRHGSHVFPTFEKWSVIWQGRAPELVERPSSKRPIRDSGNDPALGIRTEIIGAKGYVFQVLPEVGCTSVTLGVSVQDTGKGRTINLQPLEELPALAKVHSPVILTGVYRWPDSKECDASILWVRKKEP
jgi:hypothetical protein